MSMPEPDISLREYVDAKVEALMRESAQQFASTEKALDKSHASTEQAISKSELNTTERLDALRREAAAQFAATEQAISKSDNSNEKRFSSVEDIRAQLNNFVTREVAEAKFRTIDIQLLELATLKANELLQRERVDGLRRETETLRVSSDRAIEKSEVSVEKRFEEVELRTRQQSEQASKSLPREVYDGAHNDLVERVNNLTARVDRAAGLSEAARSQSSRNLILLGLVITVVVFIINIAIARIG